ncbi:hypothetical protein [Salipiger bermudensis]|uniref:hypothetical protein n=1 Tax=Salipiger bermudensis TaxID=344736 RepID=UPI001CD7C4C6|nr:hypothetical protein [Salipiger bermudensis]MCA0962409.1 hypothetical protein [Salipiger bermudensis]
MIETTDVRIARDTAATTTTFTETDWAPPVAPLEMPRQRLEAEARTSESALMRLFRKRSRA